MAFCNHCNQEVPTLSFIDENDHVTEYIAVHINFMEKCPVSGIIVREIGRNNED